MEFQKISSPSLKDLFINQLILSGKLKIGEKLPPERQLAQSMQVSRAVVNGGIAELEKRGFLEVKPRSGTYVADYRRKGTIDTLISIMNYNGGHLRNEEIRAILEVRESLDTLTARLCIKRLSDEDIEILHQLAQKIRLSGSVHEAAEAAFAFEPACGTGIQKPPANGSIPFLDGASKATGRFITNSMSKQQRGGNRPSSLYKSFFLWHEP